MASRTTWLGGKPFVAPPRRGFFSEIVTRLGGGHVMGEILAASKMARRPKWLGGNHCFDTASPRFLNCRLMQLICNRDIIAILKSKVNGIPGTRTSHKIRIRKACQAIFG